MITIRNEQPHDRAAIHTVNVAAFGRSIEADLVTTLREEGSVVLSLVALYEGEVVGHILFSELCVNDRPSAAVALGPLAVLPTRQRSGIGGQLVEYGLSKLRDRPFAVVLGEPAYYGRFGFKAAENYSLANPFDSPSQYFMAQPLAEAVEAGSVHYRPAFHAF